MARGTAIKPEEIIELVAEALWRKPLPSGQLMISDAPDSRKNNYRIVCNVIGKSGKKLSDVLNQDQIGEVLNVISSKRISSVIGVLDF